MLVSWNQSCPLNRQVLRLQMGDSQLLPATLMLLLFKSNDHLLVGYRHKKASCLTTALYSSKPLAPGNANISLV